jgi:MoxR-like ATPase
MSWKSCYRGDGETPHEHHDLGLPPLPPWRFHRKRKPAVFKPPTGLVDAVNAALCLRRPLLITGPAGSGKSTVIESVAAELALGPELRWHITSRSTLSEALYRYDVLERIHAQQLHESHTDIARFLRLGPLGTALAPADRDRPRALLIDEIDKSDLDLPGDLLDVLESGEFEIPELARYEQEEVDVRAWDDSATRHTIKGGFVQCNEFPFIVITSNGERDLPPPFLRRCVRYQMPIPSAEEIGEIVKAHLPHADIGSDPVATKVRDFAERLEKNEILALDQLLNAVYLLTGTNQPPDEVVTLLQQELSGA